MFSMEDASDVDDSLMNNSLLKKIQNFFFLILFPSVYMYANDQWLENKSKVEAWEPIDHWGRFTIFTGV